jgi:ketosteroid isomerase-like protein
MTVLRSLCLSLLAVAAMSASAHAADDAAVLRAQADAWDHDIVRKDRAGIEKNMHARFFQIDGEGGRHARAEFIEMLLDPKLTIDPYTVPDLEVNQFGDMAQLTATTHMTGKYDGKPFTSAYRYIDTYVREKGQWRIVSVQITRLAAP